MVEVLRDVLHQEKTRATHLLLLQPTSPLRTASHITSAIGHLEATGEESLVSVARSREKVFWSFELKSGRLIPLFPDAIQITSRHNLPETVSLNGAIYLCSRSRFLETGELVHSDSIPFLMDQEASVDIDSLLDLEFARTLMRMQQTSTPLATGRE
jgi:CMP-N-acetylneuraminic acid synthetase